MPKFFVSSDIHSFYDEWMIALDAAGYDKDNPDHYLIVCGDLWDRGPKPKEVLNFVLTTPRCILIRGNHEDLLEECCERGEPMAHDYSNGTDNTINLLGESGDWSLSFMDRCINTLRVTKRIRFTMHNYFETKNYIFVHGWIPLVKGDDLFYDKDWREAGGMAWKDARWMNGMRMSMLGLIDPEKTIICGHWHTSFGHAVDAFRAGKIQSEFEDDADFSIWHGNGCIAIDGCVAASGAVNVLVLEDEFIDENKTWIFD